MDVFALTATLSLQADNFFSTLDSAAQAVVDFASDSLQTSMAFDKSMSHVQAISGKVAGTVEEQSKYMSKLISAAEEMGLQYEKTADSTETAMNIINAKAAALGHDTMFTAAEVADAFGYMAMAGWDYQEMLNGIDAVVSLSAASGEDLARTSDIVTDAITAFGLEAKDASRFSDILAVTSAKSNTNVGMMGETFKYVANEAGSFRYEIEDIAEAIGLMANTGVKASMAGTALANIMRRINDNTGATDKKPGVRDFLESQGVQIFDQDYNNKEWKAYKKVLAENTQKMATATKEERERLQNQIDYYYEAAYNTGTYRDFNNIIDDARKWWATLGDVEKAEYGKMIAGAYGSKGWKALMNATEEDIESVRNGILNSEGASQDMMNIMTDNLWGDIKKYESAFDAVKRTIGEELTPMARAFTKYGTESWDTLLNAYGEGGLDLLPEAIHDVLQKGSELIDKYLPEWKENGAKIMSTISVGISEAAPILGEVIGTFGDMIGQFLSDNAPTIVSTVSTVAKAMAPGVIAAFQGIFQGLAQALPDIWAGISSDFTGFIGGLLWQMEDSMPIVAHAIEGLLGIESKAAHEERILEEHMAAAQAAIAEASKEAENAVKASTNSMEAAYQNFLNLLKTGSPEIDVDGALTDLDNIETAIRSFMSDFTDPLKIGAKVDADEAKRELDSVLEYIYDLLDLNNISIETLASFSADGVEDLDYLIYQLIQLDEQSKEGKISTAEFIDKATPLITSLLTELGLLKAASDEDYTAEADFTDNATAGMEELIQTANSLPNGEISHTYSTHDQITNVITNYVETSNKASGSTSGATGGTGMFHARSMFGGTILQGATLFGWDAQGRPQIGGGEGAEAVVGVNSLNQQIREAVRDGLSGIVGSIAQAIGGRNEQPVYVVLDTGELVGAIGGKMDAELGRLGNWRSGGAA